MKKIDTFKRDNLLVDFLFIHKGKHNIATAKDISQYLSSRGYPTKADMIHQIVRRLMFERKLPICSLNAKGYFWAATKQELTETVEELHGRIEEMKSRIELLNSFIIN